ncbi:MAG TPA: class I SAM-dependent methyltransferase [Anaerolineae bacterium]|nr:class I SAM-dependent methyltransferase [Anaerolineae bacterium]
MPSLDYDRVAADYHRRYAQSPMPSVAQALDALADALAATRILEVGCGSGRWLEALARPDRWLTGLDPSRGMLNQARSRLPAIPLIQATGERLPLAPASFDLIILVHVLHHLADPGRFWHAARRTLAPDGAIAVVGANPVAPGSAWYIYDYFEGVRALDEARFPPWEQVEAWMRDAGFGRVEGRVIHVVDAIFAGEEVFGDAFLAKNATSQLAMLSEEAYRAGIERMRAAIAADPHIIFRTHLEMVMMTGRA